MTSFRIDVARDADVDQIRDSWRRSYRTSPLTGSAKAPVYNVFITCWMDHWLSKGKTLVARPPDWPEGVLGWLSAVQEPDRFSVSYCFTKPDFRRMGIMRALLDAFQPKGELVFTSLTPPYSDHLRNLGFAHDSRAASIFRVNNV